MPFASFLLGYPTTVVRDVVDTFPDVRRYLNGIYIQDDFRALPNLTLNLGLRYEVFTPACVHFNRRNNLDLNAGVLVAATSGTAGRI